MQTMRIINQVKYYKTVNEAFVAANPHLKEILCPQTAPNITLSLAETLLLMAQKLKDTTSNNLEKAKQLTELVKKYENRGQIGEVLLKQKIKREGGQILEEIKAQGIKI